MVMINVKSRTEYKILILDQPPLLFSLLLFIMWRWTDLVVGGSAGLSARAGITFGVMNTNDTLVG